MDEKRCRRCNHKQPVTAFAKDSTRSDGLDGVCKSCRAVQRRSVKSRNAAGNRMKWADGAFRRLHLNGRDY